MTPSLLNHGLLRPLIKDSPAYSSTNVNVCVVCCVVVCYGLPYGGAPHDVCVIVCDTAVGLCCGVVLCGRVCACDKCRAKFLLTLSNVRVYSRPRVER